MTCNDCRDAISPYLDAELSPSEFEDVKAHLASCPACASRERALSSANEQVRALPRFTAPDVLKARIRSSVDSAQIDARVLLPLPRTRRVTVMLAGWVAVLVFGVAGYALLRNGQARRSAESNDVAVVLARHLRSLTPGNLTQVVSTDQHNVKPWFNGRVDVSPPVVSLDSIGFRLVGGRVDTVEGKPAAVVVYRRRLHTINVFAWPVTGPDVDLTTSDRNGFHLIRGRRQGVELWIVSDLSRTELLDFANRLVRDY